VIVSRILKRIFDFTAALAGLVFIWPVIVLVAVAIRITMGPRVLFRQRRPGLMGRPFTLIKFRTMTHERDAEGRLRPDSDRLTPVGRFLRKTSLDELPQLWNVLKGELSFVGPRPLLMRYLDRYTPEQNRRHDVPPGITGWAQINGRNDLSWEEKFSLDLWYVDNWSLRLDLRILMKSLLVVVQGENVSKQGHATTEEFMGRGKEVPRD
jgi:sugar transferase EpsL